MPRLLRLLFWMPGLTPNRGLRQPGRDCRRADFGCCLGHEGPGVGGHPGPGPPVFSFFRGRYLGRAEGRSDGGNCTGYLRPISTNLYKFVFEEVGLCYL